MMACLPAMQSSVSIVASLLLLHHGVISSAAEIVVESVRPSENTGTLTRYGLTRDDLQRISSTLPGVQQVIPERTMPTEASYGDRRVSLELIGTVADYVRLGKVTLRQGRFLLPKDGDNRNNIAVVDTITAQRLFPDRQAIGKSIRISKHYFLIVGVLVLETRHVERETKNVARRPCLYPADHHAFSIRGHSDSDSRWQCADRSLRTYSHSRGSGKYDCHEPSS